MERDKKIYESGEDYLETILILHQRIGEVRSIDVVREMELSKKLPDMSEDEMFKLLASDGMLVKRPLLITEKTVLTGFKEDDWKETLRAD